MITPTRNPIVEKTRPKSLTLKKWLIKHFVHPLHLKSPSRYQDKYNDLAHEALLMTYPPDGYDLTAHSLTLEGKFEKEAGDFQHRTSSFWSSFFGLPNRLNKNREYSPKQFFKDSIGGWDWDKDTSPLKKLAQLVGVALLIKPILIPAFYLLGMFVKTALNLAKILTEFLPSLGANHTALAIHYLHCQAKAPRYGKDPKKDKMTKFFCWVGIIALGLLHYPLRALAIFGRAITSPGKSLKMAWDYSRELDGKKGYVMGAVAVTLSLMLTITVWAILLPFIIHFIPASASTWVTQLPGIGPIFAAIKSAFFSVGQFLGPLFRPVFGPAISGISVVFGSGPSGLSILLGIGLSAIATPIVAFGSLLAEKASNAWAKAWTDLDKWIQGILKGPDSADETKGRVSRSASFSFPAKSSSEGKSSNDESAGAGKSAPTSAGCSTPPSSRGSSAGSILAEDWVPRTSRGTTAVEYNDVEPKASNRFAMFQESLKKNSPEDEARAQTGFGFGNSE